MPLVLLEVLKGQPASRKKALLDAVHEALVEAFRIPDDDRVQRLMEHDGNHFDVPSESSTSAANPRAFERGNMPESACSDRLKSICETARN